eukprot:Clim_evm54s201 gene=Clim_evmTU54s201
MDASGDLSAWFYGIPKFTRLMFTSVLVGTLAGNFGLIDPYRLVLDTDALLYKFEFWRLVTPFAFAGRLGFPFLFTVYFLYTYSGMLEKGHFEGKPADYAWFLLVSMIICLILGSFLSMLILVTPLVLSILYVWSQLNREVIVTFMFGARFKAMYLPWVFVLFTMLMGGNPIQELTGIVAGHAYLFFREIYPAQGGPRLLETPAFMHTAFPPDQPNAAGFGASGSGVQRFAPPGRTTAPGRGAGNGGGDQGGRGAGTWGQGYRLGGD